MKLSAYPTSDPVLPTAEDATLAQAIGQILASYLPNKVARYAIKIMQDNATGETVEIPEEALRLLVEILAQMGQGNAVKLQTIRKELELYEAAQILGVSNGYLIGLLKSGEIPYRMQGTAYRIQYQDVIDYKQRIWVEQMKGMEELVAETEALGLYD
ncbi:helix-turn-helix domain-containing protein [Microseira sp. BLCC-F43]|jgi:excisionase family DNA binding protein|uniref:helix-turn-helix domain-containing protein n=1 Tax=Microseira sp. BLCC-F43 TaxID=3153602 RepID=UPI0035B73BE6